MSAPYYLRSVAGGHHKPAAVNALPDLLDAAVLPGWTQWDEGHHAGHEEARAVHPTYPDPTPNPYRAAAPPTTTEETTHE